MAHQRYRIFTSLIILGLLFGSSFSGSFALAGSPKSPSNSPSYPASDHVNGGGILIIPYSQSQPILDGSCTEYAGAVSETFADGNGQSAIVYLIYNGAYLYVCIAAQPGTNAERFASLYLDPNGDGSNYVFTQQDDFAFHNSLTGTLTSFRGSGVANGYLTDPTLDSYVVTAANVGTGGDGFEYRLQFKGLGFGFGCRLFGIATYHHWFTYTGDDYGWPSNQWYDQPRTWQLAQLDDLRCNELPGGKIAYVFRGNTADASSFYNLLVNAGYTVALVPLGDILTTDFTQFDLILIADDSGTLDQWGSGGLTDSQVTKIISANKPIIGLGEGGYAFFGHVGLFIGWPQGWHGPDNDMAKSGGPVDPTFFNGVLPNPVVTYTDQKNEVSIYLGGKTPPSDVISIGLETPPTDHSPLILQGCRLLWGNSGNPNGMTANGTTVFLNGVSYMINFQCPTPPLKQCVTIVKEADPPASSTVTPGEAIHYSLTVTLSKDPSCDYVQNAVIVDYVPSGTTFIPGSASDGISPGADGALVWNIPLHFASPVVQKEFSVVVDNSACTTAVVANSATVQILSADPYHSNLMMHNVNCQPIGLPHQQPDFAEEEITVDPYPLIVGHPSTVRVRVSNFTASNQPVNVAFQTSPDHFGIGLLYSTFDSKAVIIPANGNVIVEGTLLPAASGHWCIQIVVTGPALTKPLVTQSNLDVTENLVAGMPDTLTFMVGNPTPNMADILLVVDNTCPGWSANITNPAGGILTSMAPNEVREAALEIVPPNPVVFGTGCHIDVQGWIGNTMIGGIRKLDIPPVHLPHDYQPPWEEPEISFNPDPPMVGQPTQYCIQLQNPLGYTRSVTLDYAIADFGAGISFTSVSTQTINLPPYSIANYCITWWPSNSGTLHRCALVTLHQDGYLDETSQRNVDLVNVQPSGLGQLDIPFIVGNPDLVTHTLTIEPVMFGIDPFWHVQVLPDPPPDLRPSETMLLHLGFMGNPTSGLNATTPPFTLYGDSPRVEVSILMDGVLVGGFTVEFASSVIFLPVITR